jgi:hypothetical protein
MSDRTLGPRRSRPTIESLFRYEDVEEGFALFKAIRNLPDKYLGFPDLIKLQTNNDQLGIFRRNPIDLSGKIVYGLK